MSQQCWDLRTVWLPVAIYQHAQMFLVLSHQRLIMLQQHRDNMIAPIKTVEQEIHIHLYILFLNVSIHTYYASETFLPIFNILI